MGFQPKDPSGLPRRDRRCIASTPYRPRTRPEFIRILEIAVVKVWWVWAVRTKFPPLAFSTRPPAFSLSLFSSSSTRTRTRPRTRLKIEAVFEDGRRMNGENKRREFRSHHPKTAEDEGRLRGRVGT